MLKPQLHFTNQFRTKQLVGTMLPLVILLGTVGTVQQLHSRTVAFAQASQSHGSARSNTQRMNPALSSTSGVTNTLTPTGTPALLPAAAPTPITSSAASAPAVVSSLTLYVDAASNVTLSAQAYAAANPTSTAVMSRLATTPMASWFGDWDGGTPQTQVASYVDRATAAGQVPVLVAYNIPERDCGSYSAGGATNATAYKAWIDGFVAGIGARQAIVIVEPDALAGMGCLRLADQQTRSQLITYAVQTLHAQTKAAIYIDAGNSGWQTAAVMASRLQAADIAEATGFSLNVANFRTTSSNTTYGASLSKLIAHKHFVIDTSRNGNGSAADAAWCNPDGRAFGLAPTLQTGNGLIDAYLWIKNPGESDGACGSSQQGTTAPAAGEWWPQYALMLGR